MYDPLLKHNTNMYEESDLGRANQLKELGYYPDIDVFILAKIIYERRQQNPNKDDQQQFLRG